MQGIENHYYYLNEDHSVRPCAPDECNAQRLKMTLNNTKHMAFDKINGFDVSTVWLGINHAYSFDNGPPLLFETMVFDKDDWHEIYMDIYSTWDEAVEGHKRAIQWILDGCKQDE